MNIYKRIPLVASALLMFSGCNIYRQVTLPTPYYPENTSNNIDGSNIESSNMIESTSIDSTENSTINSETIDTNEQKSSSTTPLDESKIKVRNKTVVSRISFPESEYKSLSTTGSATVSGSIYVKTAGGNNVYGKSTRLYLNPATSYSTQWFKESYLGGAKMSKVDPKLFNYLKFTTSDSNGKFEFLNIPSGSYYLIGVVKCGTACGYSSVKTIRIAKKISVFGSNVSSVDLSKTIQ